MFCPACRQASPYRHVVYNKWFTLYFIPLFPTGELGRVVLCCICQSQFREAILDTGSIADGDTADGLSTPESAIVPTSAKSGGINDWKDWRPIAFIGGVLILVLVGFGRLAGDDAPRPLELIVEEGQKLYKKGKLYESTVRMSEALQRYPGEPSVYMERGITYLSRRDYVRALADFDEAIRGKPNFGEAYLLRSIAYDALGAQVKAEEDRKRAASFGVRDVRY